MRCRYYLGELRGRSVFRVDSCGRWLRLIATWEHNKRKKAQPNHVCLEEITLA
jgi:hypothetical protein